MVSEREHRITLDVVIITKNQAWNVRRLIGSVLAHTAVVPCGDVILVDSASTDETVELASEFPIRIVRLTRQQRLTAAAGRQAGLRQTSGDLVLFLDGDMELRPGWVRAALAVLEEKPDVAAVSGQVIDQPKSGKDYCGRAESCQLHGVVYDEVSHGGGAAVYRREVLDAVGSFNPFLYSDEEPELCLRIREAGHRIVQLRMPIADHYSDPTSAITTLFGRRRRNLYLGPGQALRLHLKSRLFMPYAKERGYGLIPAAGIAAGAGFAAVAILGRDPRWMIGWVAAVGAIVGLDAIRRRSLHRAVFGLFQRLLYAEGTLRGFLMRPNDPAQFPYMIEVVK
jgi:glycosyltransferase involved in cell wall biosynthesis